MSSEEKWYGVGRMGLNAETSYQRNGSWDITPLKQVEIKLYLPEDGYQPNVALDHDEGLRRGIWKEINGCFPNTRLMFLRILGSYATLLMPVMVC
jgi:hypothetical protein